VQNDPVGAEECFHVEELYWPPTLLENVPANQETLVAKLLVTPEVLQILALCGSKQPWTVRLSMAGLNRLPRRIEREQDLTQLQPPSTLDYNGLATFRRIPEIRVEWETPHEAHHTVSNQILALSIAFHGRAFPLARVARHIPCWGAAAASSIHQTETAREWQGLGVVESDWPI
jgi:hypothetical protein